MEKFSDYSGINSAISDLASIINNMPTKAVTQNLIVRGSYRPILLKSSDLKWLFFGPMPNPGYLAFGLTQGLKSSYLISELFNRIGQFRTLIAIAWTYPVPVDTHIL